MYKFYIEKFRESINVNYKTKSPDVLFNIINVDVFYTRHKISFILWDGFSVFLHIILTFWKNQTYSVSSSWFQLIDFNQQLG